MKNNKIIININIILILVCIFLCICAVCINLIISESDIKIVKSENLNIKEAQINDEANIFDGYFKKWEKLTISEQFSSFNYNNNRYSSQKTKITKEDIEKKIGNETLTGISFDSWADAFEYYYKHYNRDYNGLENVTVHNKKAELFSIKSISKECAIAVRFEGDNDYYVYIQLYYKPLTLGDFVKDVNLKETASFGKAYYEYYDKDKKEYIDIEFDNIDNKMILDRLFSNLNLETLYDDSMNPFKYNSKEFKIGISSSIPLLGEKNKSVELTDTGYLTTNILGLGKTFYIGEDKVEEFLDYIKENYKGNKKDHKYEFSANSVNESSV